MNLPQLLSIREASKALKVHPNTLRNWEKEGLLVPYSIDGKRFKRYRQEDILALLQNQTHKNVQVNGQPIELLYYKAIIDNCDDAIIGKTLSGVITSWNPGAERMFGYKPKEAIGQPITILFPEDRKHEFQKINSLVQEGEAVSHYQAVRARKDKRLIAVDVTVSPIKNAKGEVIGASSTVRDITEQKKAEVALRESEERFRVVVETSIDLIALLDIDGTYLYISPSHKPTLGYSPADLLGKKLSSIVHPDDLPAFRQAAEQSLQGERATHNEFRLRHKNGKWILAEGLAQAVLDETGMPTMIIARAKDITKQKQAEVDRLYLLGQIDAERTFLKAVVANIPYGVFITEAPSGKVVLANHRAEDILKHPIVDNAAYETYEQYKGYHQDGSPYTHEEYPHIRALVKGETVMNEEMSHFSRPGHKITISVNAAPIKDNEGNIIAAVVAFADITEKKRFEEHLQFLSESSKILSSSLDYTQTLQSIAQLAAEAIAEWVAIDILNDKGDLEFVGGWHTDPKKYKIGLEFRTKFPVDKRDTVGAGKAFRLGKTIVYGGIPYHKSLMKQVKNKERLDYYLHKLNLQSSMHVPLCIQNKVIGVISLATSDSKKKFTKDEVFFAGALADRAALAIENARLYKEAKEAISTRDEFISMASHELKTPITSLKIHTQLLQKKLEKKNKALYNQVTKMDSQIRHLTRLITDLLDLSRLQSKKLVFHKRSFAIDEVVEDVVTTMRELSDSHQIQMRGAADIDVFGDPDRIGQVLTNLISNAEKYSPPGGKIIVSVKKDARNVVVSVKDFGIGINKEDQTKIFERFYQVSESVDKTFPGLGIGLYLSAEIMRNHNGKLWVESEKGKGSTFSFSLPIQAQ